MEELFKGLKTHLNHYFALLIILGVGTVAFYLLRYTPAYRSAIVLTTSVAYVLWGIIHHWAEGDFHLKIVLEYILIALLANLVILSLLFRA